MRLLLREYQTAPYHHPPTQAYTRFTRTHRLYSPMFTCTHLVLAPIPQV